MGFLSGSNKAANTAAFNDAVEAQKARDAEAARIARLDTSIEQINRAFSGFNKVGPATTFRWSKFKAPAAPPAPVPLFPGAPVAAAPRVQVPGMQAGYMYDAATDSIYDPKGKAFKRGERFEYQPKLKERNDPFAKKKKELQQGVLDVYQPEVNRQYKKADEQTLFQFADAGTLNSSARARAVADLVQQKLNANADVQSKADDALTAYTKDINNAKTAAIVQANAVEDPTQTVNDALTSVKTFQAEQPQTSPLGEVFKVALIGGANAMQGYRNQQSSNRIRQAIGDTTITN